MNENELDKWNPELFWRILRLSKTYRQAVDQFAKVVKETKHTKLNTAFRKFSEPCEDFVPGQAMDTYRRLRRDHVYNSTGDSASALLSEYAFGRKFLAWFGDVVKFPIDYNTIMPREDFLNQLWNFRPASISHVSHVESFFRIAKDTSGQYDSMRPLPLFINLNFTDATIAKAALQEVQDFLAANRTRHKSEGRSTKSAPNWSTYEKTVRILEIKEAEARAGVSIELWKIYDSVKLKSATALGRQEKANVVSNRISAFNKKGLFERPEPDARHWADTLNTN